MSRFLLLPAFSWSFLIAGLSLQAQGAEPVPEVEVVHPAAREFADYVDIEGHVQAARKAELRARVSGYLVKVHVDAGDRVKEGDLLFEIDPRPFKADVALAEARLLQAKAHLELADKNQARAAKLHEAGQLGQDEYDRILADRTVARAQVAVAQAELERAQLTLSWTRVTAPFAGQVAGRLVDSGNLVKADDTVLGMVLSQDPVNLVFNVSEDELLRLAKNGTGKDGTLPVAFRISDEDRSLRPAREVKLVPLQADPGKSTVQLRTSCANPDHQLVPGLKVEVRVWAAKSYKVLLVPNKAEQSKEHEPAYVFVVNEQDVLEERLVNLVVPYYSWEENRELLMLKSGLELGDRVMTSPIGSLKVGTKVKPKEVKLPSPEPQEKKP